MRRYAAQGPDAPRGRWLTPHLRRLEAEAIEIMREVACECRKPVLLYSIGKDSSVLLHIAGKRSIRPNLRFRCSMKFREMIAFRDQAARVLGACLDNRRILLA
jgi:sulfate adenylyltransferase subunit 2